MRGLADVSVGQQPPDPRAADRTSGVDDRRHFLHGEAVRAPERGEGVDGARAPTAERKVRPNPDFYQRVVCAKLRDEDLGRHPSDDLGKWPDVGLVDPEHLDEAGSLFDGAEGERRAFRTQHPLRVRVERHTHRARP